MSLGEINLYIFNFSDMKKFIISFLFIIVGLFIVDRIGGLAMWWVNQNSQDASAPKIKYVASEADEDVILMGTSRCNFHYVPSVIKDSIGMTVYNGGIDASDNIYFQYILLNLLLEHHNPDLICLEVSVNDFSIQPDPFCDISFLAPYIGKNEQADSVFRVAGSYWRYQLSHLYRYNAKAVSNIGGLLINKQAGDDHGFVPIPGSNYHPQELEHRPTLKKTDIIKLSYVERFITQCKENGVKVVLMISPLYAQVDADYYKALKTVASDNDVPFLDYHTQGLFLDRPDFFKDNIHLNGEGAKAYSAIFASDLKKILDSAGE